MTEILTDCAQPLFYYFLRKTGRTADAEDLAADVLTAWIAASQAGKAIDCRHAWVWQVARNRYAAWAEQQRRQAVPADLEAADMVDRAAPVDLLESAVRTEEMTLLRRELAFIRRKHRELIVAHYIRGERLSDIASRLRVPIGTVKAQLSRCRSKIREGMEMAREFGPRSYNPERMDFVTSGNQPSGLPERAMQRRIALNILLEASGNPSAVEDLAMALGVAVPYMEDEVNELVKATLLKPIGSRYVTDFYIMPCETAGVLRRAMREEANAQTGLVKAIAVDALPLLREIAPDTAYWPDSDLLWWLLPWVHERVLFAEPRYISDLPERPCGPGETWGIVGFEKTETPDWEPCFMGRCVSGSESGAAGIYNYDHPCDAMWERAGAISEAQMQLLLSLKEEERSLASLTSTEQPVWQSIEGCYAHAEGDRPMLDVIFLNRLGRGRLDAAIRSHPAFPTLQAAVSAAFDRLMALLEPEMGARMKEQLSYVASHELVNLRMMVLNDCLEDGVLTLPKEPEKSAVGIWLET